MLRTRNFARLSAAAARELDTDEQGLSDAVRDAGEAAAPLTWEVLTTAAHTTDQLKIDALARVWARGLGPDADLREDLLMVRTLAHLESPHVEVLGVLAVRVYAWEEILTKEPQLKLLLPMLVGALRQLGLIEEVVMETDFQQLTVMVPGSNGYFRLTDWGRLAVRDLEGRSRPAV